MKKNLQLIGLGLLIFILGFIFAFLFKLSFLNIFVNFGLLTLLVGFWTAFGVSIAFSVLLVCYYVICVKSTKSTKFRLWLSQNFPKLILFYIILAIIFTSIKPEIIWSFDEIKNVISLEWTIFGISITIFLVWNVVILNYLEKEKPIKPENQYSIQKWEYISKKEDFYPQASYLFNTVTLLILNLFILLFATCSSYIVNQNVNLFNQNFVIVSFYFSSNTLIALLFDILHPLMKKKKEILEETKVTTSDIKEKNELEEKIHNAAKLLKEIEKLESISEEQKEIMKTEIAFKALGLEDKLDLLKKQNSSE